MDILTGLRQLRDAMNERSSYQDPVIANRARTDDIVSLDAIIKMAESIDWPPMVPVPDSADWVEAQADLARKPATHGRMTGVVAQSPDDAPGGGHYDVDAHEPLKVGRHFRWPYELTAAYKYMARCGKKAGENPSEAIRKAAYLLTRYADFLDGKE